MKQRAKIERSKGRFGGGVRHSVRPLQHVDESFASCVHPVQRLASRAAKVRALVRPVKRVPTAHAVFLWWSQRTDREAVLRLTSLEPQRIAAPPSDVIPLATNVGPNAFAPSVVIPAETERAARAHGPLVRIRWATADGRSA